MFQKRWYVLALSINEDKLRIYGLDRFDMRSLPLHPSQTELYACEDYADFELTLRPTYDFVMELLSYGAMIEVMNPLSLRQTMHEWIKDSNELYGNAK